VATVTNEQLLVNMKMKGDKKRESKLKRIFRWVGNCGLGLAKLPRGNVGPYFVTGGNF